MNDLVEIPEHLKDLTEKQQIFVQRYVAMGGAKDCQRMAALEAGYAEGSASVTACVLLKNPKIMEAIKAEVNLSVRATMAFGWDALREFAQGRRPTTGTPQDGKPVSEATQFKAILEICNRSGMLLPGNAPQEVNINVQDKRSTAELQEAVASGLENLGLRGLTAEKIHNLLTGRPVDDVIEADFEDVTEDTTEKDFDAIFA